jgi:TatD DNase family protein
MKFFDTHAHVNFKMFADDADETIKRSFEAGVWMVLVGAELKTSKRAVEIANRYDRGVYVAVGLHPIHLHEVPASDDDYDFMTRGEEYDESEYERLARSEKVVAIGEIGLDYHHLPSDDAASAKRKQQEAFIEQLTLARRLGKPAIIHCREAHDDMLGILTEFRRIHNLPTDGREPWGVMHCFTGNEDLAWKYIHLGLFLSFTGVITFSGQWDEMIRKLPIDRIMTETDSPFMTPVPLRGRRNEPAFVVHVAEKIAKLKNLPLEKAAAATFENAVSFFGI